MDTKPSFLRNHADTLAIIGVNVGVAALLISLWISNLSRVDAANTRIDTLFMQILEVRKESMEIRKETNDKFDFLYTELREYQKVANDKFYDLLNRNEK